MPETDLYPAVKHFLHARGFDAKGEVCGCDVVATGAGTPPRVAIVELKLGFTLDLVLQAVDRLPCADEVWLAVPATRRGRDRDARVHQLCRRLGLGLLAVAGHGATVLAEPAPYRPRPAPKRRAALLREHAARRGDPSPGGTGGVPVMTAYRQEALACATRLRDGPLPTRALKADSARATAILRRNVYGWFERHRRGVYGLTPAGHAALMSPSFPAPAVTPVPQGGP